VLPGSIIVVFEDDEPPGRETTAWMKAQEDRFVKAWDNDEDAVYDSL
jgi:uncharacterized membrane protein YdfJ with MMPL/SSD domain